MKKAVIFDMDGTMFDTEKIWKENWERVVMESGYEPDPEFPKHICGTSGDNMLRIIEEFYPGLDAVELRSKVRKAVGESIAKEVPVKKGLYEIVDYFKERGFRLAVASSSNLDKIKHCVRMTNLEEKFDMLFSGNDIKHGKPAPDIFLKAADSMGVDPAECYILEDGLNGVYAGIASGADTVMVIDLTEPDEKTKQGCTGIYNSLTEVMDAMKSGEI